jgi:hypothetical protein
VTNIAYRFNHHNTCPIWGKDKCSKTDTGFYFCLRERAGTNGQPAQTVRGERHHESVEAELTRRGIHP